MEGPGLATSPASAPCPSQAAPGRPGPAGCRQLRCGPLWGREGLRWQALGLMCQGWEMGRWRARPLQSILKIAIWQLALDGLERLAGPKPSGQAGPIPVTRWGAAQQGHHHVVGVHLGQRQKALVQTVLGRRFCVGHEPLVDGLQDVRCLEEKCLRVGLLPEQSLSRGPLTSASLPTTQCLPKRVSHAQQTELQAGHTIPQGLESHQLGTYMF